MDCDEPYQLLYRALALVPSSHYFLFAAFLFLIFVYNFLEIHFVRDFVNGFGGDKVLLTYSLGSELYQSVASKCRILHGRYFPTLWLSSPHLQTAFLSLFGNAPRFSYKRHLFRTVDGGTIALDWLLHSDVTRGASCINDTAPENDKIPILIVIPGLTSDSAAAYVKHLVFKMARQGWNVVVSNHRGLGGVSITSDCFYNAGWTEDIRKVVGYIHCQYPEAPLFAVGTSIGANILVKYLGEDGVNTPVIGAAAVCSPWDLMICDRFISRRLVQKFYNKVLTLGLLGYAELHRPILTRLANWEGIKKSRSVRDFDDRATRVVGKFETVDAYYRHSSCASFVRNVSIPLLCISALDDPVCTKEAIPWDECRLNENIILVTTQHGGHLAYYEGIKATHLWWVRAVDEFSAVLKSSPYLNKRKIQGSNVPTQSQSSIDEAPYVNVTEDGMVTAVGCDMRTENALEDTTSEQMIHGKKDGEIVHVKNSDKTVETPSSNNLILPSEPKPNGNDSNAPGNKEQMIRAEKDEEDVDKNSDVTVVMPSSNNLIRPAEPKPNGNDSIAPVRRRIERLSRYSRVSIWLLAYIAIVTTWPVVGSALVSFLRKRFKRIVPSVLLGT